jgi:hypothetical protein
MGLLVLPGYLRRDLNIAIMATLLRQMSDRTAQPAGMEPLLALLTEVDVLLKTGHHHPLP